MQPKFRENNQFSLTLLLVLVTLLVTPGKVSAETTQPDRSNSIGVALIDSNPADRSRDSNYPTATVILPACDAALLTNCLEAVSIYKNGLSRTPAISLGQAAGAISAEKLHSSLPLAGEAHLYQAAPESGLSSSAEYSVKIVENFLYARGEKKYKHMGFAIFVQPYLRERNQGFKSTSNFDWSRYAWSGDGEAGRITNFADDVRVSVSVRIPKNDGGWFSGRIADPTVKLTSGLSYNLLTVDALPVTVPRVQAWVPIENKTPLMSKLNMSPGGNHLIESGFDDSVNWVEQLRPVVQDRSTSEETAWVVRSTFIQNSCFPNSRVSGFVTTNSMAYSWNPPVLKDGFLDYQVAGMHTTSSGELAQGSYDLVLNSDTARCLYKFNSAPISATVSIIGSSNETRTVATTILTERDGFLKLSANGFTFSNPLIRVRLTQTQTPSKVLEVAKSTITCIKGKISKKVTGRQPKCPTGYKKK